MGVSACGRGIDYWNAHGCYGRGLVAKFCTKCNLTLQESDFYKNKSRYDGLSGWCKKCTSIYMKKGNAEGRWDEARKKWREENIEKVREYGRNSARKWGMSEKGKEYKRAYQRTEKYAEWRREYSRTPERKLAHKIENSKPERIAQRKEYQATDNYKQIRKIYRQSTAGKQAIAAAAHRRYARKAGLDCDLTTQQWRLILDMYANRCAYCGSKQDIQQDHVIPISRGGGTTMNNIVPACRKCNQSKKDKTPIEWLFMQRQAD